MMKKIMKVFQDLPSPLAGEGGAARAGREGFEKPAAINSPCYFTRLVKP
jgi:hypothetical protein